MHRLGWGILRQADGLADTQPGQVPGDPGLRAGLATSNMRRFSSRGHGSNSVTGFFR